MIYGHNLQPFTCIPIPRLTFIFGPSPRLISFVSVAAYSGLAVDAS